MARAFARKGRGKDVRYSAKLDAVERAVVAGLMEQVHELVAPEAIEDAAPQGEAHHVDDFDAIVSGLGGLGMGVSLSPDDQLPDDRPVPADARSFGDRDPALERLLPAGNRADDQASAEFRRLTEHSLRTRKARHLESAMGALRAPGSTVELDERVAIDMVVALTDVRLVLGERLGLREDADVDRLEEELADVDDDDPRGHAMAVYDFLTWLQETLASAMLPGADHGRRAT
ncbi:hypothetical protein N802_01730 [Knoellia sinensis KCTC 19936]|uniref:Uncharacterized protein n=1 Tax=Knoellia sinensis KCTC 19936 TaxID=1385520 RepID=A0A0A0JDA2_9MICO|nr:DUF2017 family protein [Knoellia sinensis]KGN34799.1 hypothetical protein N802_01730 [Knoellia sinensis KCTC 19936]